MGNSFLTPFGLMDMVFEIDSRKVAGLLTVPLLMLGLINYFYQISPFNNLLLAVTSYQLIITSYLSYMLFKLNRANSMLPILSLEELHVEKRPSPWDGHTSVQCTVWLKNSSYGQANIKNVNFEKSVPLPPDKRDIPVTGAVSIYSQLGATHPVVMHRNEKHPLRFQINGFQYYEKIVLTVEDTRLGEQNFTIPLSEISFQLKSKQEQSSAENP